MWPCNQERVNGTKCVYESNRIPRPSASSKLLFKTTASLTRHFESLAECTLGTRLKCHKAWSLKWAGHENKSNHSNLLHRRVLWLKRDQQQGSMCWSPSRTHSRLTTASSFHYLPQAVWYNCCSGLHKWNRSRRWGKQWRHRRKRPGCWENWVSERYWGGNLELVKSNRIDKPGFRHFHYYICIKKKTKLRTALSE